MTSFEKKLEKAREFERKILQALAIYWEPIAANDIQKLLKVLGIRTHDGKIYSVQKVSETRNILISKGLIHHFKEQWGSGYQVYDNKDKEFLMRQVIKESWFDEASKTIQREFSSDEYKSWYWNREQRDFRLLRDYRLAIYQKNVGDIYKTFQEIKEKDLITKSSEILVNIFLNPFQTDFLGEFETEFQVNLIPNLLENAISNFERTADIWEFVSERNLQTFPVIKAMKAEEMIIRGNISEAVKLIDVPKNYGEILFMATASFFEKDYKKSILFFEEVIKLWKQIYGKKKGFPLEWQFFLYGLALYKTDESKFHKFAEDYSAFCLKIYSYLNFHRAVNAISYFLKNNDNLAEIAYSQIVENDFYTQLVRIITASIVPFLRLPTNTEIFAQKCRYLDYDWGCMEAINLLKNKGKSGFDKEFEDLQTKLGFEPIGNIIPKVEDWERALNMLEVIAQEGTPKSEAKTKIDETRVAWQLNIERCEIQPVEQKFSKKGWTDGRNIALKRLKDLEVKKLTEQDINVVKSSLKSYSSGYYGGYEYDFLWERAIEELIEHPYLFSSKNPSVNLQLVKAEPNLIIKEIGEELELSFDLKFKEDGIKIQKETETRYKVIKISKNHVAISDSLKNGKLRVPKQGREKLLKAIQPLTSKISVQSDLEEHFENLPSVEADTRIHALITPVSEGFHLEFFVKPFEKVPPYSTPLPGLK